MKKYNIAIVGATGLVGSTFIKVLGEKNLPINNIYLFASKKSAGKRLKVLGKEFKVILLSERNIKNKKIDFALFSAGGGVSREFAPIFKKYGCVVIDNSSAWRMDSSVPLVVPQVNKEDIFKHNGIIANPNCSTIQCMAPLKVLDGLYKIKSINYTTFQAVSGSGIKGIDDLEKTTKGLRPDFYPYPIYNNVLPHIGSFKENGYTEEEIKMINETIKILHLENVQISATCCRVPILNSHSVEIDVEFEKNVDLENLIKSLKNFESIVVADDVEKNIYPLPTMATGTDNIYVGRIRKDLFKDNTLHFFTVADNIRKGAASNAIEIMEELIKKVK